MKRIIGYSLIIRVACMVAGFSLAFSANASKIYFVHNDHLGTPQVITDENKNVRWEADKDPWGNATHVISSSLPNNISLPGQYNDLETGYADNGWRSYDSKTGQYLQADLTGLNGGVNIYSYAEGDPSDYIDPLGLFKCIGGADCGFTQPMNIALKCFEDCANAETAGKSGIIQISSGARPNEPDKPNIPGPGHHAGPHKRREAADITCTDNPNLPPDVARKCYKKCFPSGMGQQEWNRKVPRNSDDWHYHIQNSPGGGGMKGWRPGIQPWNT